MLATLCLFTKAQKIGHAYLPLKSASTPSWFKIFYEPNFSKKINVLQVDKKVRAYETALENAYEKTATHRGEELIGEENEDVYLMYYKRWRNAMKDFIQDDGTLLQVIEQPDIVPTISQDAFRKASPSSNWRLIGPVRTHARFSSNAAQPQVTSQVNIYACAMAASNHDVIYAAPETGGIFKTTDKGQNWVLIFDDINVGNNSISTFSGDAYTAIDVHPNDPNTVYIGRRNLIRKSTDGGVTWATSLTACNDVNTIAIDQSNPDIIYAACDNGLYKTIDAGITWTRILTNPMKDVVIQPGNSNTLFVIRENIPNMVNLFKSTDGGTSFVASSWVSNITSGNASRMAISPNDPNKIYVVVLATTTSDGNDDRPYIFKSDDAAANWSLMCIGQTGLQGNTTLPLGMSNGQGYYDLDIMVNPLNANEIIVASSTAYKSIDGAVSFNRLGGYGGSFPIHPDIQCMIANGNDTWIATDGGMNYSSDFFVNTSNFSSRNDGLFGTDFWGFTQGWNEDIMGGGKYHNGNTLTYETYPSGSFIQFGGGEAPTGYYIMGRQRSVAFSDLTPNGVVAPEAFNGLQTTFEFTKTPNENNYGQNTSEVEFLPYCSNIIFSGSGNIFWKSVDGGKTWTTLYDFGSPVRQFEISRHNTDVMYLCTDAGLWKTTNAGVNWTAVALPTGQTQNEKKIALSFTDENQLWITAPGNGNNNKIFKTTNGGATWTNLTTPTINGFGFRNLVLQAGTDGGVYIVAKGANVFYRNNTMADWASFSASLPKGFYPLRTLAFYRDGKLRMAGNRGIWENDFYEESIPVAQPMVDKLTSNCIRDTFYFDDFSALKHDGATWAWNFSGTPTYISSTSVRNPKVVFGRTGTFDFSLTVTNSLGSSSKTITGKIVLSNNECGVDTIPGKVLTLAAAGDHAQQLKPINITTNTITLSCWIKPSGTQSTNAGIIFSGSGGACGINFTTNNQLGYHWANSAGAYGWSGGPTVTVGEWSHIALTISPTNATIYLNGIPYSRTGSYSHVAVLFDQIFKFGRDRTSSSRYFTGMMDEVCIYNRALSTNEIRELMHLTKNNPNAGSLPNVDLSLISYYQFNESVGFPAYDKVAENNVVMLGNADKTTASSAPVGGGTFQRLPVTTGGLKDFETPGVALTFSASGTYPNGDIVVSRINVPSNGAAALDVLPNNPISYYVIRNFGTNATFSSLTEIKFKNVQGTTDAMVATPNGLELYKRTSNAEGATWNTAIDNADVVTNTLGVGTVTFSTGLSNTTFSQFSIGVNNIVIPVRIISFTANVKTDNSVLLQWKVAEQIHLQTYQVEHSIDGIRFTAIGNVTAANITHYNFVHAAPSAGINYYRLKMIDTNDSYQLSEIKKVNITSKIELLVNPNPAIDRFINFIIKGIGNNTNASVSITNTLGQIVQRTVITDLRNNIIYKMGIPASGIYVLKITLSNGMVLTKKVEVN
jgi:photosystem II stability/assembly factor-like uncharacterized protein